MCGKPCRMNHTAYCRSLYTRGGTVLELGEEQELLRRARSGDQEAMAVLFEAHRGTAYRSAYSLLRDRQLAEDAVQEAFVRAFRAIHRCRGERGFAPWLHAIVGNVARTMRSRCREVPSAVLPESRDQQAADWDLGLAVWEALHHLRPAQREVLLLRYRYDLKEEEMAQVLGCPAGTVKSRLFAARHALEEIWREQGGGTP